MSDRNEDRDKRDNRDKTTSLDVTETGDGNKPADEASEISRVEEAAEAAEAAKKRKSGISAAKSLSSGDSVAKSPVADVTRESEAETETKSESGAADNSSSAVAKRQPATRITTLATTSRPQTKDSSLSGNYRPLGMHDTTYRVRGGGATRQGNSTYRIVVTAVLIVALVFSGFGALKLIDFLAGDQSNKSIVTITVDQSHQALSGAPRLTDYVYNNADDAFGRLQEAGYRVFLVDRTSSSNPDRTSHGKEIICLPEGATDEDKDAYLVSEFSAFDFDALQGRLLGSWMMELSNGDRGCFLEYKYVNMATNGLNAEMNWLLENQGLLGDSATIVDQGEDSSGNFIQGYTMYGENKIYWHIMSCGFEYRYRGQDTRNLPETCAYVKIRIANWDFYDAQRKLDPDAG